ncbi:MAG: hypothetical protein DRN66_04290 [Candidatus Nanohalarchaeota archaeon]|nr:MAG: hypothetical protein DRN66_04290 [Candidatus Nanohaloarchaeota archaeon]
MESPPKNTPSLPGVYLMKDSQKNIIYIGKAKNIKKRIQQYFLSNTTIKTQHLMKKAHSIDFIATKTEGEALLLENQLIKKHQPKYNINLKDDKDYPYFCLTLSEKYPRITIERRIAAKKVNPKNAYFGPYSSSIGNFSRFLSNAFRIRQCNYNMDKRKHACIYADIGRCLAPCIKKGEKGFDREYKNAVDNAMLFLGGDTIKLKEQLEKQMKEYSSQLNYEKARELKNKIESIDAFFQNQCVIDIESKKHADYIAFLSDGKNIEAEVLFVRGGVLIGKKDISFELKDSGNNFEYEFIKQFYFSGDKIMPDIIFLNAKIDKEQSISIEEGLKRVFKKNVRIKNPKTSIQKQLMKLALKNAELNSEIICQRRQRNENTLKELKQMLSLPKLPKIIHAFDVSTIQGNFNVGASVCFVNGVKSKKDYRKFNIYSVKSQNDCAMMEEIVYRRYRSALEKKEALPNLIVIDGGKAQLNSALKSLKKLDLDVPIIGLAKREEEIYVSSKAKPLKFDRNSPAMRLLIAARNEVHWFVISFHRKKRDVLPSA